MIDACELNLLQGKLKFTRHLLESGKHRQPFLGELEHHRRQLEEKIAMAKSGKTDERFVVKRQLIIAGRIFPRGSEILGSQLAHSRDAMLNAKPPFVVPVTLHTKPSAKSRAMPAPAKPIGPNPKVEIVSDDDAVESWKKTLAAMTAKCAGDHSRAEDLLLVDERGSELFRRATRVLAERNARAMNSPSRRIAAL